MVSAVISAVSAFRLIRAPVRSPHQRTALMTRFVLRLLAFAKAETGALSAWRFLTLMRPFFAVFVFILFVFLFEVLLASIVVIERSFLMASGFCRPHMSLS